MWVKKLKNTIIFIVSNIVLRIFPRDNDFIWLNWVDEYVLKLMGLLTFIVI